MHKNGNKSVRLFLISLGLYFYYFFGIFGNSPPFYFIGKIFLSSNGGGGINGYPGSGPNSLVTIYSSIPEYEKVIISLENAMLNSTVLFIAVTLGIALYGALIIIPFIRIQGRVSDIS